MEYKTNSYIDKMMCIYSCNQIPECGSTMLKGTSVNAYTQKIPPKVDFSYINSLYPSNYPYIYYYGSYKNRILNY